MSVSNPLTPDPQEEFEEEVEEFSKWMQATLDDHFYTFDMPEIAKTTEHYVFTYGTLKEGFCRNHVLTGHNSRLLGRGYTLDQDFLMYRMNRRYGFPIACRTDFTSLNGHIEGEVWLVPTSVLVQLDFIESNGMMYYRERVPIGIVTQDTGKHARVDAWMYIGVNSYWREKIGLKDIILMDQYKKNSDPKFKYYMFTRRYDFSNFAGTANQDK
jgi:gamma-glutamylcyclotransferase (GGCT)/AIG2-like uncharacterized protein YtfP